MALTLRRDKGSELTHNELDDNFLAVQGLSGGGGYRNLAIGGSFSINPWQRGTSFPSAKDNEFTADRWRVINTGNTAQVTVTKDDIDFPTGSIVPTLSTASLKIKADSNYSPATTSTLGIATTICGFDFVKIAQEMFTISFKVKTPVIGTFNVAVRNGGRDRYFVGEYTTTSTDWESHSVTVAASPTNGTWNYTNGIGAEIIFTITAGAGTNAGAVDTWLTGDSTSTSTAGSPTFFAGAEFGIDQIMIERGSVASAFVPRSFADELLLCQQYFEKSYNWDVKPGTNTNEGRSGVMMYAFPGTAQVSIPFATAKVKVPTIKLYKTDGTPNDWDFMSGVSATNIGTSGFNVLGSANITGWGSGHWVADSEIY